MKERLGELLVRRKIITLEQLEKATQEQRISGEKIGSILAKLGFLKEGDLVNFLSEQYGVPSVDLSTTEIDPEILNLIPSETVYKYQVIPVARSQSTLCVAMADPSNIFAIDDLKFITGLHIEVRVATESAIKKAVSKYYDTSFEMGDVFEG